MSNFSFKGWSSSLSSYEGLNSSMSSSSSSAPLTFREFSLDEIKKATKNFDHSLLIRIGLVSKLYEGTYEDQDGKQIPVIIKVFQTKSPLWHDGIKGWFEDHVQIWSQYSHKHVVSVFGYCQELGEYIVVYEDMVGSLAQHLSKKRGPASGFYLSWQECLHICIDVARGMEYMHTIRYRNGEVNIHQDVSVTNIMLDANGVAKISDINFDFILNMMDVPGYWFDPENHSTRRINQGSDIYAFGVVLVKVLSRKVSFDDEDTKIGEWFKESIVFGTNLDQIINPEMKAEMPPDCLTALLHIIGECLEDESKNRPSFSQLVTKLGLLMASPSRRSCEVYSFLDIQTATNNFQSSILGQGGEGIVYKGVTKSNRSVAVKVLKPELSMGFEREIKMLSDLDHPNLVSLAGYCRDSDKKVVVYELMSNGDLHKNLYRAVKPLTWMQRLNICIGAARGLRYLHSPNRNSRKGIIHRDVKPVNILLDENYNAKISDFGLSKMAPQDQASSEIRTSLKGTTGYFAPEYHASGVITRRIDVFAFGVVLCEVLCRKRQDQRDYKFFPTEEDEQYLEWAMENIDPYLKDLIDPICFEVFVGLMEICVHVNPNRRPKMNEVVSVLEYALKWQEAQERQKCGGDLCLPLGEDQVILYCKSTLELSRDTQLFLRIFTGIKQVEVRNLEHDLCVKELKHALGNSAHIDIPQLFIKGKHVGDFDKITILCAKGSLHELLGLPPYDCISDYCQEANTCGECKTMIRWYIHCENCDALTLVRSMWEEPLRSCNECNMNQLVCNSIEYTLYF